MATTPRIMSNFAAPFKSDGKDEQMDADNNKCVLRMKWRFYRRDKFPYEWLYRNQPFVKAHRQHAERHLCTFAQRNSRKQPDHRLRKVIQIFGGKWINKHPSKIHRHHHCRNEHQKRNHARAGKTQHIHDHDGNICAEHYFLPRDGERVEPFGFTAPVLPPVLVFPVARERDGELVEPMFKSPVVWLAWF